MDLKEKLSGGAWKEKIPIEKVGSLKEKWKQLSKKKKVLVLVLLAVLLFLLSKLFGGSDTKTAEAVYVTEEVRRRNITESITGSGTLMPADSYTITTLVEGDVLLADFEVGDEVEKDAILYEIDSADAANSIEQAEISLSESQISYQRKLETLEDLNVKAPVKGTVVEIDVEVGDEVKSGEVIATVRDSSTMSIKLPFPSADAKGFSVGQRADVTLYGSFETLAGEVTEISGADTILSGNVLVRYVTIEVDNPGAISDSQMATAEVGTSGSSASGTFTYKASRQVTAGVSGTVVSIPAKEGDTVNKNATLVVLESDDVTDSVRQAANQVRNSEISLENKQEQLDSYTVKSPIKGTVIEKNFKQGDTIESGENLCTIYDLSYLTITLNVDELDISTVEIGQKVTVTADAVEGKVYEGEVTSITMMGTTSGGVTTYPVEIQIHETEGLLPGMNVSTEIFIQNAENVVTVPVSAVERGNMVLVEGGEMEAKGEHIPKGYGYREVEVGVTDGSYIEIISGIEEGESIAYMQMASGGSEEMQMMGGMPGMPSGGMPSGGMPSGGMPSGGMPSGGRTGGGMR